MRLNYAVNRADIVQNVHFTNNSSYRTQQAIVSR